MGSRTTFSRKRGIQRGETGLPGGMVGLQNQASGFGVNRDPGEAGEEAIAKQASFAGEDRVLMEARGHVGEFLLADFHSRFCLWNRDFRHTVMGTRIPHGRSSRGRISPEPGRDCRTRSFCARKSICIARPRKKSAPNRPSTGRSHELLSMLRSTAR